jgi:ATP-dependent helicase Lhr and Lhr-like helicase
LLLGPVGERLVNSYDFYAAFASGEEWQIVCDGHALGTLPIESPVFEGMCIIFAGRRWKILAISSDPSVLTVAPDPTGQAPRFDSGRPMVHARIRQEMRLILEQETDVAFLDPGAAQLLQQARNFYRQARLADRLWVRDGKAVMLLTWMGDFANNALVLLLRSLGLPSASNDGLAVTCEGWELPRLIDACSDIAVLPKIDLVALLNDVENLLQGKWDWALPPDLLVRSFASMSLDIAEAKTFAAKLAADDSQRPSGR